MPRRMFLTFRLGEALFGIDTILVREIIHDVDITRVEDASPQVAGLINLRGQVVPVLNPVIKLALPVMPEGSMPYCIIFKTAAEQLRGRAKEVRLPDEPVGLRVSAMGDAIEIDDALLEPAPPNLAGIDVRFLEGVVPMKEHIVMLLNVERLLTVEMRRNADNRGDV